MSDEKASYRQIMKATSLFGGVQVFNIIISIVRSKFVAILLGPSGMGIVGLLNTTISIIGSLTNFGLGTSAVKDVAAAYGTGDKTRLGIVVTVFRRLVWFTGLLGLVATAVFSPWLSQLTFGNKDYTLAFIWLSVSLLFNQLSSSRLVILQGMRQLKYLAKANVIGNAIGLLVTVPLYYVWGVDGIVPGIIVTSLVSLFISIYFSGKVQIVKAALSTSQTFYEGKNMMKMGFLISMSGLLTLGTSYIVSIFISRMGGVAEVGLYNAGFAIINTYVGLVFNAMGTDYYPRLSAVAHNNEQCTRTVNQQAEIALLVLAPILIIFLIFINYMVIFLYSKQFITVNTMIYWAVLGIFFKASSWAIAFAFLAKGTSRLYFWNEFFANVYTLGLNITGYYYYGLTGLGISFATAYLLYLIQVFILTKIKFEFKFTNEFVSIFVIQFGLAIIGFLVTLYIHQPYNYFIGVFIIGISAWYSLIELNKRLGLRQLYLKFRNK